MHRRRDTVGPESNTKRSALALIGNIATPVAGLATAPILALQLGPAGRGVVAGTTSVILLLTSLLSIGVPDAVTHLIAAKKSDARPTVLAACLLAIVSGLLAIAAVIGLGPWLSSGSPVYAEALRWTCFTIIPAFVVGVLRATAAAAHRWGLVTIERVTSAFFRLGALVILLMSDSMTPVTTSIAVSASFSIGGVVYFALIRRRTTRPGPSSIRPAGSMLLSYGSQVWIGAIAGYLITRLDQTLLVPLSNEVQLGLYAAAVTVSELPLIFNNAIRDVIFSSLSSSFSADRLTRAARLSNLLTFLCAAALAVVTPFLVPLAFGPAFTGSAPICEVLLLAVVVGNPGSVAGVGLSANGRPGLRSLSLLLGCALNVVCLLALVPSAGGMGAAVGTLVANLAVSISNVLWLRRLTGIRPWDLIRPRREDVVTLLGSVRSRRLQTR